MRWTAPTKGIKVPFTTIGWMRSPVSLINSRQGIVMPSQNPKDFSLDELVNWIGDSMPGSTNHTAGMAELTRRQIVSQIESTQAQTRAAIAEERAAEAAASTAASTERNARYMRWSVFAAAASAFGSLLAALASCLSLR